MALRQIDGKPAPSVFDAVALCATGLANALGGALPPVPPAIDIRVTDVQAEKSAVTNPSDQKVPPVLTGPETALLALGFPDSSIASTR